MEFDITNIILNNLQILINSRLLKCTLLSVNMFSS